MWRLKNFMPKEQNGLEGRIIDIGNLKIQIRNIIAEGGFSIVYLTRDMIHGSKQYALKHIICNDEESLDLVKKEISVMKSLMGHTNIVKLYAHKFFDMGRTKEAFLVMEYCESSLVNVLESRGATYFKEKQILAIFRDACNAVFAMHCFSPPIAHRDLKAENLLLGSDGEWKLCDFGSTSTNHKRFEKPTEMGIEEDNIRKHTTPAYRAPEMWDLYRRELINERVDIWALGCLLFRICYFKSAFDGESKLQILNGNYRIPDSPKYSAALTDLIRDMLQYSPDARPDISQIWFRLNVMLPVELQKSLPDRPPEVQKQGTGMTGGGVPIHSTKNCPMPRRSLPHPPINAEPAQNESPASSNSRADVGGAPLGAFWSTHYAKDSGTEDKINPKFDEEPITHGLSARDRSPQDWFPSSLKTSSPKDMAHTHSVPKNVHEKSLNKKDINHSKDYEINIFQEEPGHQTERPKAPKQESTTNSQNDAFNAFVTEFRTNKLSSKTKTRKTGNEEMLDSEVERLKEQLKQANLEKAEISSKYEKLSAISRSQRQEIQELKQALAGQTPSLNTDASKNQMLSRSQLSTSPVQQAKADGTVLEPQKGLSDKGFPSPDAKPWKPFADDPIQQKTPLSSNNPRSVRTRNISQNKQAAEENLSGNAWGFGTDSFTAVPATSSQVSKSFNEFSSSSQHFGGSRNKNSKATSQPAGWSGF